MYCRCDNPGMTDDEYLRMMLGLIDRHGWAVQGVERDKLYAPFAYTVGLTMRGLPELAITGMELATATGLLNELADEFVHLGLPAPGERIPLGDGRVLEVVEVRHPEAYLFTAISLFEIADGAREVFPTGVRCLQLAWSDERGRWPWEPGFRGGQFLMGPRAAAA
jgi:hypothetical protein